MVACDARKVSALIALCLAVGPVIGLPEPDGGQHLGVSGSKSVIHIGGFFAFPRNPFFIGLQAMAEMAVDHVNSLEGILDGYHLNMRWHWTGVS